MQIGDPLRTIVVEPLELPLNKPAVEPELEPERSSPSPTQNGCQLVYERPGLCLARCRVSRLAFGSRWPHVVKWRVLAPEPEAASPLQEIRQSSHASAPRLLVRDLRCQES